MWITQQQYLDNANKNLKEWFEDNNYDLIFIPLIARDYLTAYLMNFQKLDRIAPDIDWVLEKLLLYDKNIERYKSLDIRFKDKVREKDYYLTLLYDCKDYITQKLNSLNKSSFKWVNKYSTFSINEKVYNFKKDYPDKLSVEEKYLFDSINPYISVYIGREGSND